MIRTLEIRATSRTVAEKERHVYFRDRAEAAGESALDECWTRSRGSPIKLLGTHGAESPFGEGG